MKLFGPIPSKKFATSYRRLKDIEWTSLDCRVAVAFYKSKNGGHQTWTAGILRGTNSVQISIKDNEMTMSFIYT